MLPAPQLPLHFRTDARRRATLPSVIPANEDFEVECLPDGTFHLVPVVMVPKHQAWAWKPEALAAVAESLEAYHAGEGLPAGSKAGKAFRKKLDGA